MLCLDLKIVDSLFLDKLYQYQKYFQKKEYQGVATSRLVYTPATEDDGRYLTCRVLAGARVKQSLEDTWEIKVLCE